MFLTGRAASSRARTAHPYHPTAGQLLDISTLFVLRKLTGHRFIWLRATGSTVLSQAVDTLVVNFVLFSGTKSTAFMLHLARNSYVVTLALAIGLTPLIYAGHAILKRHVHVTEVMVKDTAA